MSCEICVNHVPLRKARPFLSPQGATFGSAEHAKRRDEAPRLLRWLLLASGRGPAMTTTRKTAASGARARRGALWRADAGFWTTWRRI